MKLNQKKISILGTGDAGKTLGEGLNSIGYDVVYGTRTPDASERSLKNVFSHIEALNHAEIIINTIPGQYTLDALEKIGSDLLTGKIFIDVGVATDLNPEFLLYKDISGAELIQEKYPTTKVVKTFCTMTASVMVDPKSLGDETTIFISGNDKQAKADVSELLSELGWSLSSQLDLGGIETARGQEHFSMLYFSLYNLYGHGEFNIKVQLKKTPMVNN